MLRPFFRLGDGRCWRGRHRMDGNERERSPPAHVDLKLGAGVRNAWRKAILVYAPERFEVGRLEVPDGEGHRAIVVRRLWGDGSKADYACVFHR
jgi:hypothetical protein